MIGVDAYPFLAFLDLTWHLEDMGIGVFWCIVIMTSPVYD